VVLLSNDDQFVVKQVCLLNRSVRVKPKCYMLRGLAVYEFVYWRFVVSGEQLKRSIVPNSAVVFRYDTEYLLSEELVSTQYYE